jgi:chromosome segregation ATPase
VTILFLILHHTFMTNPIIETDLGQLLSEIKQELSSINSRLNKLEVGQAEIRVKVDNIDKTTKELKDNQKTLTSDVSDLKGAKSLIIPIIVAVTTSILTLILRTIPNP